VRRWAGALAASLVLLGPACGSDDGTSAGSPPSAQLSATATRSSLFDSQRTFRLELSNDGEDAVTVASVQLASPLFAPVPASPRDTRLTPGQRLLLPVPYGESVCPASGSSALVVEVAGAESELPLAQDPEGVIEALHEVECEEAAVRAAAGFALADLVPTGPRSVAGNLVVTGRGDTAVTVDGVRGNIVFGVRVASGPDLVTVAAEGEVGRVPVELVVDRCDTHALIESKRTFKLPLAVRLDGGPPALVVLEALGPTRAILQSLIQACIG
jgi:hypothetical protein